MAEDQETATPIRLRASRNLRLRSHPSPSRDNRATRSRSSRGTDLGIAATAGRILRLLHRRIVGNLLRRLPRRRHHRWVRVMPRRNPNRLRRVVDRRLRRVVHRRVVERRRDHRRRDGHRRGRRHGRRCRPEPAPGRRRGRGCGLLDEHRPRRLRRGLLHHGHWRLDGLWLRGWRGRRGGCDWIGRRQLLPGAGRARPGSE